MLLFSFWIIILTDSIIILFSFVIFVCFWISFFMFSTYFCVISCKNIIIFFNFASSKFVDTFWFALGVFFVLCLLLRLCILIYFSSINLICFDLCKIVGYQWYWVYYLFESNTIFSNLILESDYFIGDMRLLQCNHILVILSLVVYKFWLTAVDVIHSFTLPCLGIKVENLEGAMN